MKSKGFANEQFEVEKFHMNSTISFWKMFRNTTLKMVNFEPFVEIQKDMAKQVS